MRSFAIVSCVAACAPALGGLQFQSQDRWLTAGAPGVPEEHAAASGFDPWSATLSVRGNPNGNGGAGQTSRLETAAVYATGFAAGWYGSMHQIGYGRTNFDIYFTVDETTPFWLQGTWYADQTSTDSGASFSGGSTVLFQTPPLTSGGSGNGMFVVQGILDPQTIYHLRSSFYAFAGSPMYPNGYSTFDLVLTIPTPSVSSLLTGTFLASVALRRRK
jgi:hypothetical protein